jgi:synaptojanin
MSITLISRRVHHRAGTRYNARGIDELGYVGNQCEKEQILILQDFMISHTQVCGSVPVFWEQCGVKEDVQLTRSFELTRKPFDLHFQDITKTYGRVFCINLLQVKTPREQVLSNEYVRHYYASQHKEAIKYQHFDFHAYTKGNNFDTLKVMISKAE